MKKEIMKSVIYIAANIGSNKLFNKYLSQSNLEKAYHLNNKMSEKAVIMAVIEDANKLFTKIAGME